MWKDPKQQSLQALGTGGSEGSSRGRGDPACTALTCITVEKTLAVLLGQVF